MNLIHRGKQDSYRVCVIASKLHRICSLVLVLNNMTRYYNYPNFQNAEISKLDNYEN